MTDLQALAEFKADLLAYYELEWDRLTEEIQEIKEYGSETALRQKLIDSLFEQRNALTAKVIKVKKIK